MGIVQLFIITGRLGPWLSGTAVKATVEGSILGSKKILATVVPRNVSQNRRKTESGCLSTLVLYPHTNVIIKNK